MSAKPRALYVVRRAVGGSQAGDQVHVRRMLRWLEPRLDLKIVELEPLSPAGRVVNLFRGWPVEMTGLWGPRNRKTLADAMAAHRPAYVYLIHEAIFPFADDVRDATSVLFCMNAISCLAESDPSPWVRLTAPSARAYEDRYFRPRDDRKLVLVSRADARWLRKRFASRERWPIAAPGALAARPLDESASLHREVLITGSYDWWRKRRDLKEFARRNVGAPLLVTDERAAQALGAGARRIDMKTLDTDSVMRFGLVTDRFLGGFKLKSLEYVANNAVILSRSDIRPDFEGLPDADLFVRYTPTVESVRLAMDELLGMPAAELVSRFKVFQAACSQRFAWDECLQPLVPPFVPNPALDDAVS